MYKNSPSGTKQGIESPTLGHKVSKFDKCIYEVSLTLFEMKSFVISTNKMVFDEEMIIKIYIILQSQDSKYDRTKLYMICINVY